MTNTANSAVLHYKRLTEQTYYLYYILSPYIITTVRLCPRFESSYILIEI